MTGFLKRNLLAAAVAAALLLAGSASADFLLMGVGGAPEGGTSCNNSLDFSQACNSASLVLIFR